MKTYIDDFGNRATIKKKMMLPYRDSPIKEKAFILSVYADYDNGFMYFRSVYPSAGDALKRLNEFSCGTFKELGDLKRI